MPSLLAGKLHALLCRPYPKGRDWYDLVWYLSQRPPLAPNLVLLKNALAQAGPFSDDTPSQISATSRRWQRFLLEKLGQLEAPSKANLIVNDVRDFLERPADATLLTPENLRGLLESIKP